MKRQEIKYYKVVNVDKEANEIIMLDYVFKHSPDFKGATGTRFEPVSKAQYKELMSKDSVIEHIIDSGLITAPAKHLETKFAEVLYKELKSNGELESFTFDLSYREHWDKLRAFGYSVSKYPIFNCTGGGRCFDADFKGNVSPELSAIIREYETPIKKKK